MHLLILVEAHLTNFHRTSFLQVIVHCVDHVQIVSFVSCNERRHAVSQMNEQQTGFRIQFLWPRTQNDSSGLLH